MDADLSTPRNGTAVDETVWQTFERIFSQVESILNQNRILINEISQNHESKIPANLTGNVALILQLNNNIARIVELYANLSKTFVKYMEASSEGESMGTLNGNTIVTRPEMISGQKRIRSS